LTGRPVLSADEMATTNRDMTRASLIAAALVGTLFMIVMHGWVRPSLVVLAQLLAIAWTFGFTTLSVGVLNLLSIVFVLVLIGIGKDFGVYLVMRYVECRHEGMDIKESVHIALTRTGPGVILGAVTSVCAFYSVLGSDFSGLAQLGLIGGTGILLSLAAMLVILPALLLLVERRDQVPARAVTLPFMGHWTTHPKRLLAVLTILTLLLLPGMMRVRFSYNLLELQARGLESVTYEKLLVDTADESTWYAVAVADDLAEARDLQRRFAALPTVGTWKVSPIICPRTRSARPSCSQLRPRPSVRRPRQWLGRRSRRCGPRPGFTQVGSSSGAAGRNGCSPPAPVRKWPASMEC
jgi:uncharacterized protein